MIASISEPARQTDVIRETDVLVVGSGPGGLAAALAAARAGVETVLLERYGCFGGNITQVGVEGFAWYRHPQTIDSEGIGREFEERAKAMGAAMPEPQSISHSLDAEGFKVVADTLVEEAGVIPMLHRLFVAPIILFVVIGLSMAMTSSGSKPRNASINRFSAAVLISAGQRKKYRCSDATVGPWALT
mgnify:CR=1 FL=1